MKKFLPFLFLVIAAVAFTLWFFVFRTPPGLEVKGDGNTIQSISSIIVSVLSLSTALVTFVNNLKDKKSK
jgi:ABC-type uncharacterized transport system permease subunit